MTMEAKATGWWVTNPGNRVVGNQPSKGLSKFSNYRIIRFI